MSSDKPFTETLHITDTFVVGPELDTPSLLRLEEDEYSLLITSEESRTLYEYLKRHFGQSDRERLIRFVEFYNRELFIDANALLDRPIYEIIDEFLKSEEQKL